MKVATSYGVVEGTSEGGLQVFRGLPFARAGRFERPGRPEEWDGVRDASRFGPACPQGAGSLPAQQQRQGMFGGLFGPGEVMVWIHGGAFVMGTGASPSYDGSRIAKRGDVVFVSINYRLGPLGFLYQPERGAVNLGLLDQVAALEWVRDEIARFGGDPSNVTIFGESAGGKSVECLCAMPSARGLFKRAICESTYDPGMDVANAQARLEAVRADLGADPLSVPIDDLLAANQRASMAAIAAGGVMGSGPVVDGEIIPAKPVGSTHEDVALIVGTTLDEWRLFGALQPGFEMDEARLEQTLIGVDASRAIETYRKTRGAEYSIADIWFAGQTDRLFRQHSIRLAQAHAARQPATHMYLFTWPAAAFDGKLGSCHALEIPFVFGLLDSPLGRLVGDSPAARALSEQMQDAWLAFAHGREPWARYDATKRSTMVWGAKSGVEDDPLADERLTWAESSIR
jgi:para-nitrobenzyl esterase